MKDSPNFKFIVFDLEGPLTPQDNAYELMKLFPGGDKIFAIISRYDDLLALENKEGYEPGDTLALIVPFLLHHHIGAPDICRLAQEARLLKGAAELITHLYSQEWGVFCISTSYEQYALTITARLGIPPERVSCTSFSVNRYHRVLCKDDFAQVEAIEKLILPLRPEQDEALIKQHLDRFFWEELPLTTPGNLMKEVKPRGGRRKVEALQHFVAQRQESLSHFIAVGDSITDSRMLDAVEQAGGLAIAFNANEYALPCATIGLASTHISDLMVICDAWAKGGRSAVEELVRTLEQKKSEADRENFHWLAGREDLKDPLQIHRRIRHLVRKEAARLG